MCFERALGIALGRCLLVVSVLCWIDGTVDEDERERKTCGSRNLLMAVVRSSSRNPRNACEYMESIIACCGICNFVPGVFCASSGVSVVWGAFCKLEELE